jgi:hypothetical protein
MADLGSAPAVGTGVPPSDDIEDLVRGGLMSNGRITRERRERERGSFTSGELYRRRLKQRRRRWVDLVLGVRGKCARERKGGTRVMPGLYMDREKRRGSGRGWRPAALPFMSGGLCGAKEQEKGGKRHETERG